MESVEFLGFGLNAWITIVTVFSMFTVLLFTKWRSDIVFLGAIGVLFVTGVLDAKEAFSGFSSTSVVTVGVLFVVVAGLMHTGVLQCIVRYLLGTPKSYAKAVMRLMLPVAALSSFLSNTTVVSLFVNIVKMWAKKLNVSPSKLLIPLSYASGMGGDRLIYAGQIDELIEMAYTHKLVSADHHIFSMSEYDMSSKMRTAYVTFGSSLIGKTIGNSSFEKDHHLTLAAVARCGERIDQAPRNVVLKAGDTLLLLALKDIDVNASSLQRDLHFFDSEAVPIIDFSTLASTLIMIAMVVVSALGILPLLQCAFLAAAAMLICRCCNMEQAMRAVNWEILMVFAGSAVLGLAIQKTGIAEWLANGILDVCGTNPIVVMTAVCFVATFVTEFISNTAAGAMFFPIMYEAALKLGFEPFPFLIALMISVSSSFATPIGSPTHMLVYGPGGYRFSDFIRIGLPMNLIILAANIFIVNVVYPLTPLNIIP